MNPAGAAGMGREGGGLQPQMFGWSSDFTTSHFLITVRESRESGCLTAAVELFHDTSESLGWSASRLQHAAAAAAATAALGPSDVSLAEVFPPSFRNKDISGQLLKRFKTSK